MSFSGDKPSMAVIKELNSHLVIFFAKTGQTRGW